MIKKLAKYERHLATALFVSARLFSASIRDFNIKITCFRHKRCLNLLIVKPLIILCAGHLDVYHNCFELLLKWELLLHLEILHNDQINYQVCCAAVHAFSC